MPWVKSVETTKKCCGEAPHVCLEPRIDNGVTTVHVGTAWPKVGVMVDSGASACLCRLSVEPLVVQNHWALESNPWYCFYPK